MFTYSDLLHSDGTLNRAAFESILASRVLSEIAMRLCIAAGQKAPRTVQLGEQRAWYRAKAAELKLGPIGDAERARIAKRERDELETWVKVKQASARHQRRAMDDAYYATAAE